MEARRILEDYFSDVKLFLFKENNDLYTKSNGKIPLEEAATLANTNQNILKSAIKDSLTLKIEDNNLLRKTSPKNPDLQSQTLVFGPFNKFTPQKFVKLFALKSGQVCPMLAHSYLFEASKLAFLIFRTAEDKQKFVKNYPETVQEKDYDFTNADAIWNGVDVHKPTLNNQDFARIHKNLKKNSVCYTPSENRIKGLVFEKDEELEVQKQVKKQKEQEQYETKKIQRQKDKFETKNEHKGFAHKGRSDARKPADKGGEKYVKKDFKARK